MEVSVKYFSESKESGQERHKRAGNSSPTVRYNVSRETPRPARNAKKHSPTRVGLCQTKTYRGVQQLNCTASGIIASMGFSSARPLFLQANPSPYPLVFTPWDAITGQPVLCVCRHEAPSPELVLLLLHRSALAG